MSKWIHVIYLSIIAALSYFLWQQPTAQPLVTKEIEVVKTTKTPAVTVAKNVASKDESSLSESPQATANRTD